MCHPQEITISHYLIIAGVWLCASFCLKQNPRVGVLYKPDDIVWKLSAMSSPDRDVYLKVCLYDAKYWQQGNWG